MDQNNSKICFFAQLPLETQNLIYSFLAKTFSNISAQKEEYEKYQNL